MLHGDQCRFHVGGELQLLSGDEQHLLHIGQRGLVAAARHLLVQRFQRGTLGLRFGEFAFQHAQLAAQLAHQFLILRDQRLVGLVGAFHLGQAPRHLLLHLIELIVRIQPLPHEDHHQHHQRELGQRHARDQIAQRIAVRRARCGRHSRSIQPGVVLVGSEGVADCA